MGVTRGTGTVLTSIAWAGSLWSSSALAAEVPGMTVTPLTGARVLEVAVGLIVVVACIALGAWVLRRTLRGVVGTDGALRVVGALSLGARERVLLLQVGSRQLLLGVSPGRIQTLYVLEDPLEVPAAERRAGRDFAAHLSGLLTRVQREDRHEPRP